MSNATETNVELIDKNWTLFSNHRQIYLAFSNYFIERNKLFLQLLLVSSFL
jgi:hypothetical protein